MTDLEATLARSASTLLRSGEQIAYAGFVSRNVPMAARLVPLARTLYARHFVVLVTSERLLFVPAGMGLFGDVSLSRPAPTGAIELCDVASVEAFNPVLIGQSGFRVTLRTGLAYDFTYLSSVKNLPSQANFAADHAVRITRQLGAGLPGRAAAERSLPPLDPAPMLGAWALLIGGVLLTLFTILAVITVIAQGFAAGICALVPMLLAGCGMIAGGVFLLRRRAAMLGREVKPIGDLYRENRKSLLVLVVGGFSLFAFCGLGIGGFLAYDAYRRSVRDEEMRIESETRAARDREAAAATLADEARYPGHAWDAPPSTQPTTLPSLPDPQHVRAALTDGGFVVADATERGATWALEGTGTHSTVLVVAVDARSDGETSRAVLAGARPWVLEVTGPSESVRLAFLDAVRAGTCLGPGVAARAPVFSRGDEMAGCVAEVHGQRDEANFVHTTFRVGGAAYEARVRTWSGPPERHACLDATTGVLCVRASSAYEDMFDRSVEAQAARQSFIAWTLSTIAR